MTLIDHATAAATRMAFGMRGLMVAPRLSILIFHRVLQAPDPLFPGEIDAPRFDRLMQLVARSFRVMTLSRALACMEQHRLPPRALVVTFDDGYADNAEVALPILRRHGIAATFFVSTGFLDGGRMWNDTVIEALRATMLDQVDLGELGLGPVPLRRAADRVAAIDSLLPLIKHMGLDERERALQRLLALLHCPSLPDDLMMRREQVRELHSAGMEIGAHTVHHPILAAVPPEQAWAEIVGGRDELAAIIDAPVDVMAYPNGRPVKDYVREHVDMVRKAGFRGAVTTAPGAARAGDDLFQLPRFTPWDRALPAWSARLLLNQRRPSMALSG